MKQKVMATIVFIYVGFMVFFGTFVQAKNQNYFSLKTAGQTNESCEVVFSTEIENDIEIYNTITNLLDKYNGNLYCFDVETKGSQNIYTKYIYANNLSAFNSLGITEGRFFSKAEMDSEFFLSTEKSNSSNQIGIIDGFSKYTNFQIKTLKNYLSSNSNTFQKKFVIDLPHNEELKLLSSDLEKCNITLLQSRQYGQSFNANRFVIWISLSAIFILVLIVLYNIIKSYKAISVERMMGFDLFSIWAKRIPGLLTIEILVFLLMDIVLSLTLFETFGPLFKSFLLKVNTLYFVIVIITAILLTLPFIYIRHITASSILKYQRPFKSLIRLNTALKTAVSVGLILSFVFSVSKYQIISFANKDKFDNWKKAQPYAFVYELQYTDESFNSSSKLNLENWKSIYLEANKYGAILADFSLYSPKYEQERSKTSFPEYSEITINPNYLKVYPIKDSSGNEIHITEDEKDFIVLVPQKYKNKENEIIDYFRIIKNGYMGSSKEIMERQQIRIIWIADNQYFFSMRLDVGTETQNCIINPLVRVITESNGALEDYSSVAGSKTCPFKIKVKDYRNPMQEINTLFSKYFDLTRISFPSTSIFHNIEDQVNMAHDVLKIYILLLLVLAAIGFALVLQGINTFVEQSKKVLAIKKFLGYRYFDKYIHYYILLLFSYIFAGILAFLICYNRMVIFSTALFATIDFIVSAIYIAVVERQNIILTTKGG